MQTAAIEVSRLSYCYATGRKKEKKSPALKDVGFLVAPGEFFGIVGPNGGGKSTLFKLLSTLLPLQSGSVRVNGFDLKKSPAEVRGALGVVFQSPALDKKLTLYENLRHEAWLYGLPGEEFRRRSQELVLRMGLGDYLQEPVERLSGGYRRRVEIAKTLLHRPSILLLDEPTTGLDPLARRELWNFLRELKNAFGMTILSTTHLLEEAENWDRVLMLYQGEVIAFDTPDRLKAEVGGDVILLKSRSAGVLKEAISDKFNVKTTLVADEVRIESKAGHEFIPKLVSAFSTDISAVLLRKPTLEDYFMKATGHRYGIMTP